MAQPKLTDPYSSFQFVVEIDGITQGFFRECTGLSSTVQVIENPEGGLGQMGKLPGRQAVTNIVLKRGLTDSTELFDWHRTAVQGTLQRKGGYVVQLDHKGDEKRRWHFTKGWVTRWEAPSFNAGNNEISVETVEICHEGLELV